MRVIRKQEVNQVQPSPTQQTANLQNNANFVAEVVREVGPAVVRIDATRSCPSEVWVY
jgi:S1-C subfamily serine protease